jgi:hypothetical protein
LNLISAFSGGDREDFKDGENTPKNEKSENGKPSVVAGLPRQFAGTYANRKNPWYWRTM